MARIPLALAKPKPGETREEFAERFADEMLAALEPYRTRPATGDTSEGPQEPGVAEE